MSEWNPGDLAVADSGVRYIRVSENCGNAFHDYARSDHWHSLDGPRWASKENQAARPLVVIDPEDREQVARLMGIYAETTHDGMADGMQAALREFAKPTPPKPDEPQGLGAVVEDEHDRPWVRADHDVIGWTRLGEWRQWDEISAVRVLSEGIS